MQHTKERVFAVGETIPPRYRSRKFSTILFILCWPILTTVALDMSIVYHEVHIDPLSWTAAKEKAYDVQASTDCFFLTCVAVSIISMENGPAVLTCLGGN